MLENDCANLFGFIIVRGKVIMFLVIEDGFLIFIFLSVYILTVFIFQTPLI